MRTNQSNPCRTARKNNQLFDNLFQDFFSGIEESFGKDMKPITATQPSVNISEREDGFHLEIAAPGLAKDAFSINLDKNILTVKGEKKEPEAKEEGKFHKREFNYKNFKRSFTLPENVDADNIKATYENGILRLILPKNVELETKKEISIG